MNCKPKPSKFDKKAPSHPNELQKALVICNRGHLYNVRVPCEERREEALCLSASEYERILARARGPSFLAKEKEKEALDKALQKKKEAAEEKKRQMIEKDRSSIKTDVQTEAMSKKQGCENYRHMRRKAQMERDNQIVKLDSCIERCKIEAAVDTQCLWKKQCEAVALSKDKAEFERELQANQELLVKHQEKDRRRKEEGRHHLDVLSEQIRHNEHTAAIKRREKLYATEHVNDEVQLQKKCIDELKQERLKNFRASGIPEKYYLYAERKTAKIRERNEKFQYHPQ
nr:cilia- and flagella-associated protein 45-like [Nerophis lumbriciformis]